MLTASTELVTALTAAGREPVSTVKVDFERNGYSGDDNITAYVSSVQVQRSLTTDVPSAARLVTGYSASSATVDLQGDATNSGHDGAWLWSPTNPSSPYYGRKRVSAPIQVSAGFTTTAGPQLLTRFTGYIRSVDTDGGARTAEIQALDGSDHLRTEVELPMETRTTVPGLDGRHFIDIILAANNVTGSDLEPSLNELDATPYVEGKQDAWTLIQQIAAAEMAVAFFDEQGRFHFWNRNHFGKSQVVDYAARTVTIGSVTNPIPQVTSTRALKSLTFSEAVDSVINHVKVHYTSYEVQPNDIVWQASDPIRLGVKETRTIWADFDNPVALQTDIGWIGHGLYTEDGKSGFRACRRQDGTGDPVGNLSFTITPSAQRAKIVITNPNPFYCYLVSPARAAPRDPTGYTGDYDPAVVGEPMLWLKGQNIIDKASFSTTSDGGSGLSADVSSTTSIAAYGEQLYEFDAASWIQDELTARSLADDLLSLLGHPMPTIGDVEVVADPRLQIGDRIELIDSTGTAFSEHCWIVGITDALGSDSGYAQTLTLRMCAGIGSMIWGHPVRGFWGQGYAWGGVY